MLNCKITKPVGYVCDTNVSGIMRMAILNWSEEYTFTASGSDCVVDTIDLGADAHFLPVNIQDNSGTATAVLSAGSSTDSKAINHTVTGIISQIDCDIISDWKNWLLGTVIIAVLTKNRQVLLFGVDNGMTTTNFDYTTGAAAADALGITFLYEGVQKNPPLLVKDWSVIRALYPEGVSDVI